MTEKCLNVAFELSGFSHSSRVTYKDLETQVTWPIGGRVEGCPCVNYRVKVYGKQTPHKQPKQNSLQNSLIPKRQLPSMILFHTYEAG